MEEGKISCNVQLTGTGAVLVDIVLRSLQRYAFLFFSSFVQGHDWVVDATKELAAHKVPARGSTVFFALGMPRWR